MSKCLAVTLFICLFAQAAAAQTEVVLIDDPAVTATLPITTINATQLKTLVDKKLRETKFQEDEAVKDEASRKFQGINFGVAIAVLIPMYRNSRIEEAALVPNGDGVPPEERIVRATKRRSSDARIMLETHYFFEFKKRFGAGPVVVIQPGADEIIEGAGIGGMIGFRRSAEHSDSFNLGLGVFLERNVKDLGEGVEEDKPLPPGETEIRYQEKQHRSIVFLASFSF